MIIKVLLILTVIYDNVIMLKTPLQVLYNTANMEIDAWTDELDYIAHKAEVIVYNMGLYREGTIIHIRGDTLTGTTINISKKILKSDVDITIDDYNNYIDNIRPAMNRRFLDYIMQCDNEKRIVDYIVDNIS